MAMNQEMKNDAIAMLDKETVIIGPPDETIIGGTTLALLDSFRGITKHLLRILCSDFGEENAKKLIPLIIDSEIAAVGTEAEAEPKGESK